MDRYQETRIESWNYLELNAYRLQEEYQQSDCPLCSRNFGRSIIQSILFCGDRFCRDCINRNEGRRWDSSEDGALYYRWSECPVCETPYDIMRMKFPFSYDRYKGFWSMYVGAYQIKLRNRLLLFCTAWLIYHGVLFYYDVDRL